MGANIDGFAEGAYQASNSSLLCLRGNVGYRVDGAKITLEAESICSDRDSGNTSGTLVLELWALANNYHGGAFTGVLVASATLGTLNGGFAWNNVSHTVLHTLPQEGAWRLVLMLREWDGQSYVTQDFREFSDSYMVPPAPVAPAPTSSPEIKPAKKAAAAKQPAPSAVPAPKKVEAPAAPAQPIPLGSINKCPVERLVEVDGVTKSVARTLIANRPYKTWDEVRKVKGIGPGLLVKLRERLTL